MEKRWGEYCVRWVCWAPWRKYKDALDADGEVPEGVPSEEGKEGDGEERKVIVNTGEKVLGEFFISQKDVDVEKHGYTRGCRECSS